jgi:hypothetical protein
MGAAFVSKDNRLPARSVAVFGQPASIRPELAGLALPLEDCPLEEELSILTDSKSSESMDLLKALQRADFPLWIRGHPARQLLTYVVKLVNSRAAAGSVTAAELDPSRPVDLDLEAATSTTKEHLSSGTRDCVRN